MNLSFSLFLFIALLFTGIYGIQFFVKRMLSLLYHRLSATFPKDYFGLSFIRSLHHPISFFLWSFGVISSIQLFIGSEKWEGDYFFSSLSLLSFLCFCWIFFLWKRELRIGLEKKRRDYPDKISEMQIDLILKVLSLGFICLVILRFIHWFGFDLQALLTVGGVGALAIGLAAKELLQNFFGGALIYFTAPFKLGEIIRLEEKNINGFVEEIGWYFTKVRDFEKIPIYLPNSFFLNQIILNQSRRTHRRLEEKVGIRYSDFPLAREILKEIDLYLSSHSEVDKNQPRRVRFFSFGENSVTLYVCAYLNTLDYSDFLEKREEILFEIGKIISSHKAAVAFPTRTLYIEDQVPKEEHG